MENKEIDFMEESIDSGLLKILLKDRSTGENIIWATSDYERFGYGFRSTDSINSSSVVGRYKIIIRPRVAKHKYNQADRTREKAEVFTPAWVCNKQNNLIDEQWFGKPNVFNYEIPEGWKTNCDKISFPKTKNKSWQDYVRAIRLEVTCGEAPYLVSRYDAVNGKYIEISERIGILDRKIRVINENVKKRDDWYQWIVIAYKSVYGFEFQGDNLLLARENLLLDFIDNYTVRYKDDPPVEMLKEIATIISWNIWQMDGITYTIPLDKVREKYEQISIFDTPETTKKTRYAKIKDWTNETIIEYRKMI